MGQKYKLSRLAVLVVLGQLLGAPIVLAQPYTSPSHRVDQVFFGTGGELESTSPNFKAHSSAGSLGVGSTSSANFDAETGFLTPSEPFLELVVSGATVNLGLLSDTTTSSGDARAGACNCSFTVRTYLSQDYVVKSMSQPPTSEGGATLDAKTTLGAPSSDPNTEEFGINVVDNTNPNIGANPFNDPDNSFADGEAATGYNTPDQFKYVAGDTIARSPKTAGNPAIGKTAYTISYIAKRKPLTEAGLYTLNHDIVVIATY